MLLNSISSVLSYNQFDFGPIFKHGGKAKEEKRGEKHQSTFAKQLIYFILFFVLNLGFVSLFIYFLIDFIFGSDRSPRRGDVVRACVILFK